MVAADPMAAAPVGLAVLIGSIVLLSLRAWLGVMGATVDRRSARVLNGLIFLFVSVFGLLVIVRFATLA
jgi:hypothetical protein